MAKAALKEVAKVQSNLPANIAQDMLGDVGKNVSTKAEDNLVPFLKVLQKMSPQVDKRNDAYIEDAEAGLIWLRNYPDMPLVNGDAGIVFQPCFMGKEWIEWVPREKGGGVVARWTYDDADPNKGRPDDCQLTDKPGDNRQIWMRPNGNEVIETRSIAGFVHLGELRLPYVLPLQSTGHTFAKEWNGMWRLKKQSAYIRSQDPGFKFPDGWADGIAPSYAYTYRLVTKHRSNSKGDWFQFQATDEGPVSAEDYQLGRDLYSSFLSGEKKAEIDVGDAAEAHDAAERAGI